MKELKELPKEDIIKFICTDTFAQSLLYDLDLLPEQLEATGQKDSINWMRMIIIGNLLMNLEESGSKHDYAYKTIEEYKSIVWPDKPDMEINDAFRIGWDMARITNKMIAMLGASSE